MPNPLLTPNSLLLLSPEADSDSTTDARNTMRRATPHELVATGGSTTTVATGQFSGTLPANYVGCILEVVSATNAIVGQHRRIASYVTGTATVVPAFSAAVSAGDTLRMWIPPESIVAAEVAGAADGTTVVADADADASGRLGRDEPANYWSNPDRYMLIGYGGANLNRAAQVVSDVGAAGGAKTFTVEASVFAQSAIGDLYLLRLPVKQMDGAFAQPATPQAYIGRRAVKAGDWDGEPGVLGPRRGGTFTMALEVQRLAAASVAAGAGTAAQPPAEAHDLLASLTTYAAAEGGATAISGALSTTVKLDITTATDERTEIGRMLLVNGEACAVIANSDGGAGADLLGVTPALTAAPASGVTVFTGANYSPRVASFRSWSGEVWFGGGAMRRTFHGWLPGFRLEGLGDEGGVARLVFEGPYDYHWHDPQALPTWITSRGGRLVYPSPVMPQIARVARFSLSPVGGGPAPGVGTNAPSAYQALTIKGFSFTPGLNPVVKNAITSAAHDGAYMAGLRAEGAGGTIALDLENADQIERFERGARLEMLLQLGASAGGTFVFWARRIELTAVADPSDSDGRWATELTYKVLASDIRATSTGQGSGIIEVPQWVATYL